MPDLRDVLRRTMGCCVAAVLTAALWPWAPLTARAAEDGDSGEPVPEALLPASPASVSVPGMESDEGPGEEARPEDSTGADAETDAASFQRIELAFNEASYTYREATRLDDSSFEEGDVPAFASAYRFQVNESATSAQLEVGLEDPTDLLTLSVMPTDMPADPVSVKVDAFQEDGADPVASLEFSVANVRKKPIAELSVASLPFRLDAAEQERCAARAVREALQAENSGIHPDDLQAAGEELFTDLSLTDWPGAFAAQHEHGFEVRFALTLAPHLDARYELADDAQRISVQPLKEVRAPRGFTLNGTDGGGWFAEDVAAAYAGHALAPVLEAASFQDTLPLDSTEGIHEGVALYAESRTDKVVTKVADVTYRVDKTAPEPMSFAVEGERREEQDAWFFQHEASITVFVKDPDTNVGTSPVQRHAVMPAVSGLSAEDAWVEYELMDGQRRTKTGISVSGPQGETGALHFMLDGDQAVRADSFRVHMRDRAGNVLDTSLNGVREMPAEVLKLVSDSAAPELTVSFSNDDVRNGRFFNAGRTAWFTVQEANFSFIQEYDPDQVIASMTEDGRTQVIRAKELQPVGDATWQAQHAFATDAECAVEAQVTDLAGKASERFSASFVIDATPPMLDVAFADGDQLVNGAYSPWGRTATVTVRERWFSADLIHLGLVSEADNAGQSAPAQASAWTDQGDARVCTITFPGPGVYALAVSGTDQALNALPDYACPLFTVDAQAPQIYVQVAGEEDAASRAYADACPVTVSVQDANMDPASFITVESIGLGAGAHPYQAQTAITDTCMSCSFPDPAYAPENDDVYQLRVSAVDRAGNTASKTVTWSVNRFGSTYLLSEETDALLSQRYVRSEDLCDVRIQEVNPSGWDASSALVSLSAGTRNATLAEGVDYTVQPCAEGGWPAREYVVEKSCFAADGLYQLALRSTDAAGNASMNTMDGTSSGRTHAAEVVFAVDDTAPLVAFSGFEERRIAASLHEAGFTVEDNGEVAQAVVRVNGQEVASFDRGELAAGGSAHVVLDESDADQALTVEAVDAAGNVTVQTSPPVFVNASPLARWLHDPTVVTAAIAAAVVAAAGGAWAVRHRRKQ